ncbi:MAG TPA: sigma-70 family RNA polymerase sigma factor [Acidimicrobiales bacterium]|nr:sigma-70 family RNA polymerase sigma factor [Acidimicrobiales bacterium]
MGDDDWLAARFETHRDHLRAVAFRMLGSDVEADDAVQESWLRLSRSDVAAVDNLGGWLTTVVSRISLDMLRSRTSRREDPAGTLAHDIAQPGPAGDPEHDAVVADSVGGAMLVVLGTLTPTERLAFVLHDVFAVSFEEIGTILDRSPNAAKQLASRARRKVQGTDRSPDADPARRREVIDAFLTAARAGDFAGLLAVLDPEVVLRADPVAVRMGSAETIRGAAAVAGTFSGRALAAQPAVIDGSVEVVWAVDGRPKVVWEFTIDDDVITHIDMLADPATLRDMDVALVP